MLSKKALLIIVFFSIGIKWSSAQACFDVIPRKGCAPLTIKVVSCVDTSLTQLYDFNSDGNIDFPDSTYTYTTPGVKRVVQFVISSTDTVIVEVLPAISPKFDIKSCNDNAVFIELTEKGSYDVFIIDYGDGSPKDTIARDDSGVHTYATQGTYDITVQGNFIDDSGNFGSINCGSQTQSFETIPSIAPAKITALQNTSSSSVAIHAVLREGFIYYLEEHIAGGGFSPKTLLTANDTIINVTGLSLSDTDYCYRITTVDSCANMEVYSEEICTIWLSATGIPDQIDLAWNQYGSPAFTQYELFRDSLSITQIINPVESEYSDSDIRCQQSYCYYIETRTRDGATSSSNTVCLSTNSTIPPLPVGDFRASVADESIQIKWTLPANQEIGNASLIYQANGLQTSVDVTGLVSYEVEGLRPDQDQLCASVTLTDQCGNATESLTPTCQMILTGEKSERDSRLKWTPFEGMNANFSYELEELDLDGNVLRSVATPNILETEYLDDGATAKNTYYRLKAYSNADNTISAYSNILLITDQLDLQIPTAFSPNADGLNDRLEIFTTTVQSFEMKIFNRWGNMVFYTTELSRTWDGYHNSEEAPTGGYTYIISGTDVFGEAFQKSGKILLVR